MIIDAHSHPDWHKHDFNAFVANMDKFGIQRSWLLTWECPRDEYDPVCNAVIPQFSTTGPIPFPRCLAYVERAPERFVLGYAPDPRRPEAIDLLNAAIDTYGVQVYGN